MIRKFYVLLLLFVLDGFWSMSPASAALKCVKIVETLSLDDKIFIGRMTMPGFNRTTDMLTISATFAERQFPLKGGSDINGSSIRLLFENGKTPNFLRIRFPDARLSPKLINITLNGEGSCYDNDYPGKNPNLLEVLTTYTGTVEHGKKQPIKIEYRLPKVPVTSVCGREGEHRVDFVPFVHGGTEIKRGQFPWLVAINKKASAALGYLCGGSLISARTVITAAHCLKYPNTLLAHQIVVSLGRHNLYSFTEYFERRDIERVQIHPDYDLISLPDADIALMQMESPVSFTQVIQPICLWRAPSDASLIVGENGVVAGWGGTEGGRWFSSLPKMVKSNIVSEHDCRKSLDIFQSLTTSRTICAGNRDGTGPCTGDSGSGLMLKRNGRWQLRGIVSAGLTNDNECDLREFVIYSDLAKHLQWVQDNMLE